MYPAIFGLIGVLLGVSINEFFRRKSRVELFTKEVFSKRLSVFEELYQLILDAERTSYELTNENNKDFVNSTWTDTIHKLAEFLDKNFLYLSDEVTVQCMTTLIGFDDRLFSDAKEESIYEFRRSMKETKHLLRNASGIAATEKTLRNVAGISLSTDYIKYFEKLKKDHEKSKK